MKDRASLFAIVTAALLATLLFEHQPAQARYFCPGDCDSDSVVTVDEILLSEQLLVGEQSVDACVNVDYNGDGSVTVNEIIYAINAALDGCTAYPN